MKLLSSKFIGLEHIIHLRGPFGCLKMGFPKSGQGARSCPKNLQRQGDRAERHARTVTLGSTTVSVWQIQEITVFL